MPRVTIIAHPVYAHHVEPERWRNRHGAPVLVIGEYDKYLAAWLRPVREAIWPAPPSLTPEVRATAARGEAAGGR